MFLINILFLTFKHKLINRNDVFELTYYNEPLIQNVATWHKSACFSRKQNLHF